MKRYTVRWAAVAQEDLERIINFVALTSVDNALRVADRIERLAAGLSRFPRRGRVVPELARHGIREWLQLVEQPWRLVHRIDKNRVEVVALIDGRRNLEDLIFERLMHSD